MVGTNNFILNRCTHTKRIKHIYKKYCNLCQSSTSNKNEFLVYSDLTSVSFSFSLRSCRVFGLNVWFRQLQYTYRHEKKLEIIQEWHVQRACDFMYNNNT